MSILLPNGKQSYSDNVGLPLVGGKVYTYAAGTNTPLPTYTDAAGTVPNTNPVVLDARGEAVIFWSGAYKVVLRDLLGNLIWTVDNVSTVDPLSAIVDGLALSSGSSLIGFKAAGAQAVARTQESKDRDTISVLDFYTATDPDLTNAFIGAEQVLNAGGFRALMVPGGSFSLSSAQLAARTARGIQITRDDVAIIGDGLPTITITGSAVVDKVFEFLNCSGRVQGLRLVGNSQGTGYVNGSAVWFSVTPAAAKDTEYMEVLGCTFDNFRSPYWVYGNVSGSKALNRVLIDGNTAISRDGNSITPNSQGMIATAFMVKSKVSPTDGGGGVRNVRITGNTIDATYIKSGIFLADKVQGAMEEGNRVIGAGVSGATDAAGAYAYAAYDSDGVGMTDISFINNEADSPRSVGLYIAGVDRVVVDDFRGRNQTDTNEVALPKGLVVLNGCTNYSVREVKGDAIASNGVYAITNPLSGLTSGEIDGVWISNSRNGVFAKSAFQPSSISITGVFARQCDAGIAIAIDDTPGALLNWTVSRFNVISTKAGSYGVRLFTEQTGSGLGSITIGGGDSMVAAKGSGVLCSGLQAGQIIIRGITFSGAFTGAGIDADAAWGLDLDACTFFGQDNTGYCLRLSNSRGSLGLGMKFPGVAAAQIINLAGSDLGTVLPTFPGFRGQGVANLLPSASGFRFWTNVDGNTTWKQTAPIAA